jgi:acetoacetyl-CoA synthetase
VQRRRKDKLTPPQTFNELYNWSMSDDREDFWADLWESSPIIAEGSYKHVRLPLFPSSPPSHKSQVIQPNTSMSSIPLWFQGLKTNYAENMLFSPSPSSRSQRSTAGKEDAKVALTEVREGGTEIRNITYGALRKRVALFSSAMRAHGVKRGDRVAVVSSHSCDTLCVFLGVTALGGIFSSSSTDMGTAGVLARLTQVKPRWVFVDDGAVYNGKTVDLRGKMREIVEGMREVAEFEGIVSVPRWEAAKDVGELEKVVRLEEFLGKGREGELEVTRVEFNEPFLIVYSSGTTGQPKCIVHGAGNVLLSGYKEQRLHKGWDSDTVALQYTTVS